GTDRYGRVLGVVYFEGKNINIEMVKAGLAEVYKGKMRKDVSVKLTPSSQPARSMSC
ncbi:MAG: thermonuclease family protein, partial [Planctomycetota bacterium]